MSKSQKFVIGMLVLLAALALIFWGFSKDCLQKHHYYLLHAMIPLAAGFVAWSFHGALDLKVTKSGWEGLALGAVGGFGVFVILLKVLQPSGTSDCIDASKASAASLHQLRAEVIETVSEYNNRRTNPALLGEIRRRGREQAERVLALPQADLSDANKTLAHVTASYGYIISALAEDSQTGADPGFVTSCADSAIQQAFTALRVIEVGRASEHNVGFNQWLVRDEIVDRVNYVLAVGYSFLEKHRSKGADQTLLALERMDRVFRSEANILDEPILANTCKKYSKSARWSRVCSRD